MKTKLLFFFLMICALNLHAQINISGHHRGGGLRLIDEELSKYIFYLSWNIVQTGNKFTGTSTLMDNDSKKMTFKIMGVVNKDSTVNFREIEVISGYLKTQYPKAFSKKFGKLKIQWEKEKDINGIRDVLRMRGIVQSTLYKEQKN